ncbi:GLPGLI family protein [Kaistella sp.]|uniref:GLPGLI family protein n=1 Tax=Kaistella sp. TaxID=2782235 RepID=UPI003C572A7D
MNLKFFILILTPTLIFSQNSSFIYEMNFRPNSDSIKTQKIIYFLDVKDKESIFRSDKFRTGDSLRTKRGYGNQADMQFNNQQLYIYKNHDKNEVNKYVFVPFVEPKYTIKIQEILIWNIKNEKKQIGKYDCQKAETNYGGRKWIAWFTNEIPVQDGPYIFRGLPGLIIEISDEKSNYSFSLGEVRDFLWKEFYLENSQRLITWDDFKKLQMNFYDNPFAIFSKSDIKNYDEAGNIIETDFKKMTESVQERTRNSNNPIELNQKLIYK